jgi:hypothetical protein
MKVGIAHARPMHGAAMLAKTRNLKMARSSHAYKCGRLSLGRCAAQQGADFGAIAREAKADDHAIGCLQSLDFDHRALAAQVRSIQPLSDAAVSCVVIEIVKPAYRRARSRVQGVTMSFPAIAAFRPKSSSALRRSASGRSADIKPSSAYEDDILRARDPQIRNRLLYLFSEDGARGRWQARCRAEDKS